MQLLMCLPLEKTPSAWGGSLRSHRNGVKEVRHCGASTAKCGAQDRTAMSDASDLSGSARGTVMGMEMVSFYNHSIVYPQTLF